MSTVIKIEDIWKEYRLGVISHGTMAHDLQSWWAKVRGKMDPNSKVFASIDHSEHVGSDKFWALKDINAEIKQGETLGIIGRNGSGKSTLLKILSRVTAPTKGSIKVKGRIASLLEVGTGFHPELTGRENIFLNGTILGMTKLEISSRLDEIIDFSGVEDFIETPVKRYSSGMYVRLAFAVAAHLKSEILIIDEVLAVGDLAFQRKCLQKIGALSREGRTVLFVSHMTGAVENLCSRVIWLKNGTLFQQGPTSDVVNNYLNAITDDNGKTPAISGTGEATVASIRLVDENQKSIETVQVGQLVHMQVDVQVCSALDRLVFGYGIKDKSGQVMYGTNTHLKEQALSGVNPGECYHFDISFPANLGPGTFTIETALTSSETHQENNYEWQDNALVFDVVLPDKVDFSGCVWMDPVIQVSKKL